MSYRTLIELNHDYTPDLASAEFSALLRRYLCGADGESAKALERFGARVVGMRHHADKFIIEAGADGFPPTYLKGDGKASK
jgi:hypothetical protein